MGGDLEADKVGSYDECAIKCLEDDACEKFIYAKIGHPLKNKRNMCWTKNGVVSRKIDSNYTSGV